MSEISRWIRPASEIKEDYDFLMGYHTGQLKKWYCGIEGVYSVFHGAWSDSEIVYNGYAINEPTATDGIYEWYREDTGNDDPDGFARWLREHKDSWFGDLDELIANYEEEEKMKYDLPKMSDDELDELMTNIIDEREGTKDETRRAEFLDELYLDVDSEINKRKAVAV